MTLFRNFRKKTCLNYNLTLKTNLFGFFMLTCLILQQNIFAQDENIKWTRNQPMIASHMEDMKILKCDENFAIYYKSLPYGRPIVGIPVIYETIGKYDFKTDKISVIDLNLKTDNNERIPVNVLLIDDVLHIISYLDNKSQETVYIYDETININTLGFNKDAKIISEFKYEKSKIKILNSIFVSFEKYEFQNESRLVLKFIIPYSTNKIYGYELFTEKYVSLVRYQNSTNNKTEVPNFAFDKDYNLYTIERTFESSIFADLAKSYLNLQFYSKDGATIQKQNLKLENKSITAQTLSVNDKNEVVIGGLYSCIGLTNATGVFSLIYSDKLKNSGILHMEELGHEYLSNGMKPKDSEKIKKDLDKCKDSNDPFDYFIQNIHFRKDGGFVFVAEKKIKTFKSVGSSSSNFDVYKYSDIYILSFKENGSLNWKQKIYRNEELWDNLTHTHFLGESKIEYCANDDINIIHNLLNIDNKKLKSGSPFSKGKTYLSKIDSKGIKTDLCIISDPSVTKYFCPSISYNYQNNNYLFTKINYLTMRFFLQGFNPAIHNFNFGACVIE